MTTPSSFIGIDVSEDSLQVVFSPSDIRCYANTFEGIEQLLNDLQTLEDQAVQCVMLEDDGGHHRPVVQRLSAAGWSVVTVSPQQVRDFARAAGQLATPDRVDAVMLQQVAPSLKPALHPPPDTVQPRHRELLTRHAQLMGMITREKKRLERSHDALVQESIRHVLTVLEEQLQAIQRALADTVNQSPSLTGNQQLLQSVQGILPQTARDLLAALPELGQLPHWKIAALAGVAPRARDSGNDGGQRHIRGGRVEARQVLYRATQDATRHNPVIRNYYQHLLDRGKEENVAIVACMRKLLCILNAIVRDQKPWQSPHSQDR